MDNKKIKFLFIFLLCGQLLACASVYWDLKKSLRKPGEKLLAHPEAVWEEYHCAQEKRPFLKLVKYEVLPPEVRPGEEVNQHFEYVFCPAKPAQVLKGNLWRRVYFKGKVVFEDLSSGFELKPGKWAVDAFIRIPPEASPGVYYLEVLFKGPRSFKAGQNFVVKTKEDSR